MVRVGRPESRIRRLFDFEYVSVDLLEFGLLVEQPGSDPDQAGRDSDFHRVRMGLESSNLGAGLELDTPVRLHEPAGLLGTRRIDLRTLVRRVERTIDSRPDDIRHYVDDSSDAGPFADSNELGAGFNGCNAGYHYVAQTQRRIERPAKSRAEHPVHVFLFIERLKH